ncbi:MAG TPA: agmatinase [Candidatus Thermoplasmatota archaeon]|nr:agmatinase [Candidatus Thermoplasmatota archaeon]
MTASPAPSPAPGRARTWPDELAYAKAGFPDARFVVAGVPFDAAASFRFGAAEGPAAIRHASHNLETFNLRNGVDLDDVPVHDMGNVDLDEKTPPAEMVRRVADVTGKIVAADKFPILLGGDHGATPAAFPALKRRYPNLGCILVDAHLSYRDAYEGIKESHACTARRVAEVVGPERLAIVGARSSGKEEWQQARRDGLRFFTTFDVQYQGMSRVLAQAAQAIGDGPVYLSVDVDAMDPAHAPATGTPEPYGLAPHDVLAAIQRFAPRMVGFDIMEVSPPHDAGTTAGLASRLVLEAVTEVWVRRFRPQDLPGDVPKSVGRT